jgi:hypothetical protein
VIHVDLSAHPPPLLVPYSMMEFYHFIFCTGKKRMYPRGVILSFPIEILLLADHPMTDEY